MLDPKTKIFIVPVPQRFRSTVQRDARRYGACGWSRALTATAAHERDRHAADTQSGSAWLCRRLLPYSPRPGGRALRHRSMESTATAPHRPALQTCEWWEFRPVRWRIAGAAHGWLKNFLHRQ